MRDDELGEITPYPTWTPITRMQIRKPGWLGRRKFQKEEDERLRNLVDHFGENNWPLIASHMHGRTARQCRERYKNYLSPKVNNRPWTQDEEDLLAAKVRELGQKWTVYSHIFRSTVRCQPEESLGSYGQPVGASRKVYAEESCLTRASLH